jgi:hypothetical protein
VSYSKFCVLYMRPSVVLLHELHTWLIVALFSAPGHRIFWCRHAGGPFMCGKLFIYTWHQQEQAC